MLNFPMIFGCFIASSTMSQQPPHWPYERLFKQADLVVVARALSTVDAGVDVKDKLPRDYFKRVVTTLEVDYVIKGEWKDKKIVLPHYRLDPIKSLRVANAPELMDFHAEQLEIRYRGAVRSLEPPVYMLFLKSRSDGRFEFVSGHLEPTYSVKQLVWPLGPAR